MVYADPSITSEPMMPLSHMSGKFNLAATHPKLTTDLVDPPETVPPTSVAAIAGTSTISTLNAISPARPRHLATCSRSSSYRSMSSGSSRCPRHCRPLLRQLQGVLCDRPDPMGQRLPWRALCDV